MSDILIDSETRFIYGGYLAGVHIRALSSPDLNKIMDTWRKFIMNNMHLKKITKGENFQYNLSNKVFKK
jgi:hypothetical protein